MGLKGNDRSTGEEVSYNDTPIKRAVIKFYKDKFNIDLKINPKQKKIDLILVSDPTYGFECERGGWEKDYWAHYDSINKGGLLFRTVQFQNRKEKYFYPTMEILTDWGNLFTHREPNYLKNTFIRSNDDFTQMIIVQSETVRTKSHRSWWKTKSISTGGIEEWLCFRREDVETYNLVNGEWILDLTYELQQSDN